MLANKDIRRECRKHNVRLWEIANRLDISESTMTRKMRVELPNDQRIYLLHVIDQIAQCKAKGTGGE